VREIQLTRGQVALVDDEDYAWLIQWKWQAQIEDFGWYAVRAIAVGDKKTKVLMHRAILNAPRNREVDHVNRNTLDNRRDNLRLATTSQNAQNRRKVLNRNGKPTQSQFKGVTKVGAMWRARITIRDPHTQRSKLITLGLFETEVLAALAYDAKATEAFGAFARLNLPDGYMSEMITESKAS
jgi:hypothetical protein